MPLAAKSLRKTLTQVPKITIIATILTAMILLVVPKTNSLGLNPSQLVSIHMILELFSILVSILVVVVALHSLRQHNQGTTNALIVGFTMIAACDFFHALSYNGAPDLLSENSTTKGLYFWLIARTIEISVIALIVTKTRLSGSKSQWLMIGLLGSAAIFYFGTHFLHHFPTTYVEGHGLTPFKIYYERILGLCNIVFSVWLFRQGRKEADTEQIWLAMACFILALSSLYFSSYLKPNDSLNLIGHLYKIAAYSFIYIAIFVKAIQGPYQLLQRSEKRLLRREGDLHSILKHVPHGTIRLNKKREIIYINTLEAQRMHRAIHDIIGHDANEFVSPQTLQAIQPYLEEAFTGRASQIETWFEIKDTQPRYGIINFVPEHGHDNEVTSVLIFVTDYTEREQVQQQLLKSLQENTDLKVAINAHAIVAVTDASGVIMRVNDKFCEITKYSAEEVIGKTHRIVKSDYHDNAFFINLWKTISQGQIWHGEICNRAKDGSIYWVNTTIVPFLDSNKKPVQYIAIRADITQRKLAEQEIEQFAFYDQLTGLPNRRLMLDRLQNSLTSTADDNTYAALLFIDLDGFKEINNSLGHNAGDSLLKDIATRLQRCIRQTDTAARLGGDEFVLILDHLDDDMNLATHKAEQVSQTILEELKAPFHFSGYEFHCSASIGIVMYNGTIDTNSDDLLKHADVAMYESKAKGRDCITLFDPTLQATINERVALLSDLRQALTLNQFELYYQPLMNNKKEACGVEALIRWHHPVRGMVPPFTFIELAEQSGLIIDIGQWVLETACKQLVAWQTHPVFKHWTISINVSAKQFHEADYSARVLNTVQSIGATPCKLKLELTESLLINDTDESMKKMLVLSNFGIRFSLDDFGTGYSSLSYLKQLPFKYLKIDKSFTRDIFTDNNDAAVVRTIIALAKSLEMQVVAEGVETEEQFNFLHENDCNIYQGYLFGKPMPVAHIEEIYGGNG